MNGSTVRIEDGPSEESPLLSTRNDNAQDTEFGSSSRGKLWRPRFIVHPAYLVVPVLFGTRFVAVITTTSTFQIVRNGANPSDEQCNLTGVEQAFSVAITVISALEAFGEIVSAGTVSYFATRYGRRPVMLALVIMTAISTLCFLAAVSTNVGPLQDGLLLGWIIIGAFSGIGALSLTCSMYIVDLTGPSERTLVLSIAAGFAALGTAPTYWLGAYISRHTSVVAVFWWKLITVIVIIIYILRILPESFSLEKRDANRREREAQLQDRPAPQRPLLRLLSVFRRPFDIIVSVLEPLKHLKPSRKTTTGRLNFRLLTIASSQALSKLGSDYIGVAWAVYATVRFHFKPDDLGLPLSALSFAQAAWLSVVFPAILRWGRPFYNKRWSRRHTVSEQSLPDDLELHHDDSSQTLSGSNAGTEMTSHFDVYLAIVSSFIWALAGICMGVASSATAIIVAIVPLSLGAGHDPAIKSMTVASVDPLYSGQALSALTIAGSVGGLFAPLVFGAVLSSTITKIPQLVFFLCSATIALGAFLLFFVRDSDRYVKSPTDEE